MLALVAGRKKLRDGTGGELTGVASRAARAALAGIGSDAACRTLGAEQSNTSIVYDNTLFLKLYRKVEDGENPDIELTRYLTENPPITPTCRLTQVRSNTGPPTVNPPQVLALMQSWVTSEGDAWTLTIDAVGRYFERVLAERTLLAEPPATSKRLLENDYLTMPPAVQEMIGGVYPSRAELLGKRTGELHLALAGSGTAGNPAMAPEAFNMLYQRSLLQSMSTLTRRVFTSLKRKIPTLAESLRAEASRRAGIAEVDLHVAGTRVARTHPRDEDADTRGLSFGASAFHGQGLRDH